MLNMKVFNVNKSHREKKRFEKSYVLIFQNTAIIKDVMAKFTIVKIKSITGSGMVGNILSKAHFIFPVRPDPSDEIPKDP